jgi:DNA-binding transcriptional ArsR family regulator
MAKKQISPTEDHDQQVLRRLSNIEHKMDSIEQTTAFALRADEKRHQNTVKKIFGNSNRRAQVYLAADARRGVQEIGDLLGLDQANVNRELRVLQEEGLVEVNEKEGGKTYWGKTPIDRTLRVSRFLMSMFSLNKDGLPIK